MSFLLIYVTLFWRTRGNAQKDDIPAASALKIHDNKGWRLDANYVSESPTSLFVDEEDDVIDPFVYFNYTIPETGPYFDIHRSKNVTALKGVTSKLVCRVRRLGDRKVSWIRHKDLHLLTVGRYTYTSDQRFEAFHSPHTHDWILRLKSPQLKDTGVYECQISTTPHLSHKVYLTVKEPKTYLIGGPDLYVNYGSMINLSCVISFTEKPPEYVKWYHRNAEISFRGPRDGVSVITEKAKSTTVHLLMQGARPTDSGIYKCVPSNAPSADIKIHILQGDQAAELHTNHGGEGYFPSRLLGSTCIFFLSRTLANFQPN